MIMKKLQVTLPFFALMLAVALSAFTLKNEQRHKKFVTGPYWELKGAAYDITQPSSYQLFQGTPSCEGDEAVCVIQAPETMGEPDISSVPGLSTELQHFKTTGEPGSSGAAFYRTAE